MSSRSRMTCQVIGARIAGDLKPENAGLHLDFYPGYVKPDGKKVSSKLIFKAYVNDARKEKSLPRRFTLWGVRAIGACKGFSVGKEMHFPVLDDDPYMGRVWVNNNGTMMPVNGPDGQPILTDKVGYTVREMIYGNDSKKTIQSEIQNGVRPPEWDTEGHPDYQLWSARIQARKHLMFNPLGNPQDQVRFGYARVHMPGPGCTLLIEDQTRDDDTADAPATPGMTAYAGATGFAPNYGPAPVHAPVYAPTYGAGYVAPTMPAAVHNAVNAGTGRLF